ncbi:hypothetical protein WICMUC_002098 [Wickerhamomyces mucosus]|uniref:Putative lipoate-protein ligase A n=1 Tax=Wickerhamomyces mucosus TaxID=1378264 RepID=A0A9P8PRJ9_9ASCO|nr:hypothetical protein WICMUC_002098 [Wickerhamomyces mucosus]
MINLRYLKLSSQTIRRSHYSSNSKQAHKLPFDQDHLEGDEKYDEINSFYSDLFCEAEPVLNKASSSQSFHESLDELNKEMKDLYGADNLDQPHSSSTLDALDFEAPTLNLSLLERLLKPNPKVILSDLNDPYKNLAIEEYVFNKLKFTKNERFNYTLMFYTNSPCVVIGKNQNPWKEVNLPLLNNLRVPLLRRFSGGGTVVHDLGNVNYSYISTRSEFDRTYFGSVITNSLADIKQNVRGDILTNEGLKISGSAFKISKGKSLHHGTMLLNSNLKVLGQLLNREKFSHINIIGNSTDSVRAKVANLGLENDDFIEKIADSFIHKFPNSDIIEVTNEVYEQVSQISEFKDIEKRLKSWSWMYGNTPKFEMKLSFSPELEVKFYIEKGIVKQFELNNKKFEKDFRFLKQVLDNGEVIKFRGDEICGYILNDTISEWLENSIDGFS